MRRGSLTLLVASASLIAGACAGKIHVDATPSVPVVAVQEMPVAELPLGTIRFDQLLLPPDTMPVPADAVEDESPNLFDHIEAARQMLGLIQSRPSADGSIDPLWMRELATASVGAVNRKQQAPAALTVAVPKNDDPLTGLTEIPPVNASPIKAPPIKVPPIKGSPDPTRRLP